MIRTALIAAAAAAASTLAAAQSDDHLLDFGWMSEEQRARAEAAHSALEQAEAEMCSVMIEAYVEHAARVHETENGLSEEETAYLNRRCAAEAFAAHIDQSVGLHDLIHREIHAGAHED